MKRRVVKEDALKRINNIHRLSQTYNGKGKGQHQRKLLVLMRKHIKEIEALAQKGDRHFLTETGDLAILCFELLIENKASVDRVLLRCFRRYENKLCELIKERKLK